MSREGFFVYAATHVFFHITHLAGFSTRDAVSLVVGLTLDALLPLALLVLARRLHHQHFDRQPVVGSGFR